MLVDSCGHERCYSCLFVSEDCPLCRRGEICNIKIFDKIYWPVHLFSGSTVSQPVHNTSQQDLMFMKNFQRVRSSSTSLRSSPPSPSPSLICMGSVPPPCAYASVSGRASLTPPIIKRPNYNPSPAGIRRNWVQRHNRRPNTVNIDEKSMKGEEREK